MLSFSSLKKILNKFKNKKILIVTGKKSFKNSGAKKLFDKTLKNKKYFFYFKTGTFPDFKELKILISELKKIRPNLIVAIGGGAVLDLTKISNYLINSKNLKKDILNSNYKNKKKFSKLIAIPTTAGSGAEVTSNAVIYLNKKKYSVENDLIRPNDCCLIPELVMRNNFKLKSASGFDAIAQAVESIFSLKSNKKSYNFAVKSLELSLKRMII